MQPWRSSMVCRLRTEIEAMSAEQMAATHVLAMKELGHLRRADILVQHELARLDGRPAAPHLARCKRKSL